MREWCPPDASNVLAGLDTREGQALGHGGLAQRQTYRGEQPGGLMARCDGHGGDLVVHVGLTPDREGQLRSLEALDVPDQLVFVTSGQQDQEGGVGEPALSQERI